MNPILKIFPKKEMALLVQQSGHEHSCRVGDVECLVKYDKGHQIVCIPGTEGVVDVVRDARLLPWYDRRVGWSHSGFLKGAQGLVDKGLFGMLRKDIPTFLGGHSMGGAVAINASSMLHSMGFKIAGVMTFGAPKTLRKSSVKRFKATGIPIFEYSNPGDPVPHVPHFGYKHVNEILTDREKDGFGALNNHLMEFYVDAFAGL